MNPSIRRLLPIAVLGLAFVAASCETGRRGRIMADSDQDMVGDTRAGIATYNQLINTTVSRLLRNESAARTAGPKLKIAILPVENKTVEELGDLQDSTYELIATSINQSNRYNDISRRFVAAALKDTGLNYDQLFLPRHRRAFVAALEATGNPVDALLFPRLTSGSTPGGSGYSQRDYLLTLELVDIETGEQERETARVRKEYVR